VDAVARILLETHAKYYTCHCTGLGSYWRLKAAMGDDIDYLATGNRIII
jgi:7,8-dihydropterin-6-yl-methyl-4-(beta-D-ribofuranosyl)aminobenzene 5'-phosphate synthase